MTVYTTKPPVIASKILESGGSSLPVGAIADNEYLARDGTDIIGMPTTVRAVTGASDQQVDSGDGITKITGLDLAITVPAACTLDAYIRTHVWKITGAGSITLSVQLDSEGWVSIGYWSVYSHAGLVLRPIFLWAPLAAGAGAHTVTFAVAASTDSVKIAGSTAMPSRSMVQATL